MTRETQNPVYPELVKYEAEYEQLTSKIELLKSSFKNSHIEIGVFLKRCLFLIFPGVLYIKKKKEAKKHNEKVEQELKELIQKREDVCNESRAVFFSKQ